MMSLGLNANLAAIQHSIPPPMRMPSSKLPKGRHLIGDHVVYDIDVRIPGEVQPQLEVTPITKYGSDPGLVVGRQIAVNKTYICYGLKLGAIRVLNINTALRSLLKGLSQRVTDMAFFAEDVHLLASASVDGRVYVWKITEGPDEEDKPQITGKIVIALQIVGEGESVHPRVCWHCHKQEVLVVAIGRSVLRIDTTKVGKGEKFSAEEPLRCHVDKLIDGVQFVGNHDGEVTDLSMCQWMTTRLVSASVDGTIKIWEDRKLPPIAVLRPHDGLPVNSVTFLTAPQRPDHIILITGGPMNREMKIWSSESEEGWLLPSDADSWQCTQTLELNSSACSRVVEAFFNQVVALSPAGLLLLANAKKNAIYAIHLDYGQNPAATRMDYIAEFTVTMPILSFTGTSDLLPHGEQIVQVYCVQTQAIQQYALDLTQCLPPPLDHMFDRSDSFASRDAPAGSETPVPKPTEIPFAGTAASPEVLPAVRQTSIPASAEVAISQEFVSDSDVTSFATPPVPLSPRLSRKLSGFRSPSSNFEPGSQESGGGEHKIIEYSVDRQMDTVQRNLSDVSLLDDEVKNTDEKKEPPKFRHPTHLVTPSEILRATSSSDTNHVSEPSIQDVVVNDMHNVEVEVKVVGETRITQNDEIGPQVSEQHEKSFSSQVPDLGIEMSRECFPLPNESYNVVDESRPLDEAMDNNLASSVQVEVPESSKNVSGKAVDPSVSAALQPPAPSKGKKQKGKAQGSAPASPSPSVFKSTDSLNNEPGVSSTAPSVDVLSSQIVTIQETLDQLVAMGKESQKQISAEGKRIEAALGRHHEKSLKSNVDALWARLQEEHAKQEKLARERFQQLTNSVTNSSNKDLVALFERTLKKELVAVGPSLARAVTPVLEKIISTAITEAFQRGVGDKAVNQLEKSVNNRLETTVARQIQAQFQTSGKQALQEALKSSFEASVIPGFEMSCKAMFDQIDSTFQKGLAEHTSAAQQQFESTNSPLAHTLRDAINSASSITQTLSSELADGQRKLVALAVAGANSPPVNPLVSQLSNGPLAGLHEKVEADPTKELSRLVSEHKYEEAFTSALQRSDVSIVSWLCSQVDLQGMLMMKPCPLGQGVLLSLLQQLACDFGNETARKLEWMTNVVLGINPADPMIALHVHPIFEQVYQILSHSLGLQTLPPSDLSKIHILMFMIHSKLK